MPWRTSRVCVLVLLAVVTLAVWLAPGRARAETSVVLATRAPEKPNDGVPSHDRVESAVLDRLTERGLKVTLLAWPEAGTDPDTWLADKARARDAKMGIGVELPDNPADPVRIRVVDRVTDKTVSRNLQAIGGAHDAERIALAVDELVDASLSELELGHRTLQAEADADAGLRPRSTEPGVHEEVRQPGEAPVGRPPWEEVENKQAAREKAPDKYRFGVDVAGGVLWPVKQKKQVMGILRVRAGYTPDRNSWIGPEVTLPVQKFTTTNADKRAETLLFSFGAMGAYDILQNRPPVHFDIMGALTAVVLDVRRHSTMTDNHSTIWTGTGAFGLRLRFEIRRFDIGLTARIDAPFKYRKVQVDGTTLQDFSALWLSGMLNVRARF